MTLPSLDSLEAAAELVHRTILPTPQIRWPLLCARTGADVWVKTREPHRSADISFVSERCRIDIADTKRNRCTDRNFACTSIARSRSGRRPALESSEFANTSGKPP